MLFWFLLACWCCHNTTLSQETEQKEASACKVANLVDPDWAVETNSCTDPSIGYSFGNPPFQGRQLPAKISESSHGQDDGHRHEELEMWDVQNPQQEKCSLLPSLWWSLGTGLRGRDQPLGVAHGLRRFWLPAETKELQCKKERTQWKSPSPKRRERQGERQRKGERKGEGQGCKWGPANRTLAITLQLCRPFVDTHYTMVVPGSSIPVCTSTDCPAECNDRPARAPVSPEEGIHRGHDASRSARLSRAPRNNGCKAGDEGTPYCDYNVRQIPASAERRATAASSAQGRVDSPPHRICENLGAAVGGFPEAADGPERSRAESLAGHQSRPCHHPTAQPSCRDKSYGRDDGPHAGGEHRSSRQRGNADETTTATNVDELRYGTWGATNGGGPFGWRGRGWHKAQKSPPRRWENITGRQHGRSNWPNWQNHLVTIGCFFTCPLVKGGSTQPWQYQNNTVEAYHDNFVSFHGAAGSVVLSPNPWRFEEDDEVQCPFSAIRTATQLRTEVLADLQEWNQYPGRAIANDHHAIRGPKKARMEVKFDQAVDIIVEFNGHCKLNINVSFTHDQIQEWKEKPWSLKSRRPTRRQSPPPLALAGVDSNPQGDGVDTDPETRTGFSTVDERKGISVADRRPLGHALASTQNEAEVDSIVAKHTKRRGLLHIETFGYHQGYIGQRRTTVRGEEIQRWREKVRLLWNDHYDSPPFLIFPIRPPATTAEATVSVIVQMGQIQPGNALVLVQKVIDGGPHNDPTVISAPHYATRGAVMDSIEIPQKLQDTAVLKQGFAVWRTGFRQRLQDGDFLRILLDDPEAEESMMMQTETAPGTLWRTWPEPPEDYIALREVRLNEEQQDDQPQDEGDIILHDPDEWMRLIAVTQQAQRHQVTLQVHGLLHRGIGMRRVTLPQLSLFAIQEATRSLWPQLLGLNKKVYLVQPQPDLPPRENEDVTVLLEFVDQWHQPDETTVPLLHECFLPYNVETNRIAAYSPLILSSQVLQIDADFCPATPSDRVDFWLCYQSLAAERRIIAKPGGLLTIRVTPMSNLQGPQHSLPFPGGLQFAQHMTELTSLCNKTSATWTFVGATEPGNPATLDYVDIEWAQLHNPNKVLHFFSNLLASRGMNVEDYVLYHVPSHAIDGTTFVYGKCNSQGSLVHLVYSAKWDERWREQYCHVIPTRTTTMDIAARVGLQEYTWNLFLDGRPADHQLNLYNGALLEIELEDGQTSNESGHDIDSEYQDSTASRTQTDESALGQLPVAFPAAKAFGITPWPTFTFPATNAMAEPTTQMARSCKPNPALGTDFDEELPYRTRNVENGRIYERQVPPPNWAELPILGIAIDNNAMARDTTGHLFVHLRTWLVFHDRESPEEHRDGRIRAQLMVNLHEKIRQIWREHIDPQDQIRSFVIRPTPALGRGEGPKLLLIVECNRPQVSQLRPILVTYQQLDERGLSPDIWWKPLLVPQTINLQILADECPADCEPHHILAPLGTEDRRWMANNQNRPMVGGRYIPVWWDMRRRPPLTQLEAPTTDQENDDPNLFQMAAHRKPLPRLSSPHVLDLWCGPSVLTDDPFCDVTNLPEGTCLMQRAAGKRRKMGPMSRSASDTTPQAQAFHVFRAPSHYHLLPINAPTADADRLGHLTGTLSRHFGFPSDDPAQCHAILSPIADLEELPAFIYEHGSDSFQQMFSDDVLALVDITIHGSNSGVHRTRRTHWLRLATTRKSLLATLRCGDICVVLNDPPCSVSHNSIPWAEYDDVRRHFDSGDYVQVDIKADKPVEEILSCLRNAEIANRTRRVFLPSPEPNSSEASEKNSESNASVRPTSMIRGEETKREVLRGQPQQGQPQERKIEIALDHQLETAQEGRQEQISSNIPIHRIGLLLNAWKKLPLQRPGDIEPPLALPPNTSSALEECKETPAESLPYCHIFTDGSFGKEDQTMAWSFVVIRTDTEDYKNASITTCDGCFGGLATTDWLDPTWHGASHPSSYIAELEALLHAHWWALSHDYGQHLHFHFDSLSAGFASSGHWGFQTDNKLGTLTRSVAQALEACTRARARYSHVAAHQGDPWNELADTLAQAIRQGEVQQGVQPDFDWTPLLAGTLVLPAEGLPMAFMLLQGRQELPRAKGLDLQLGSNPQDLASDRALWPMGLDDEKPPTPKKKAEPVQIKCATFNVRTMHERTGGAAEYLRCQLGAREYGIVALQETRAKQSTTIESADYIRLISAGQNGREGCEIWFNKTVPLVKKEVCTLQHLTVLHAAPDLMAVRLRLGSEFLVVVCAHAPHSGRPEDHRQSWWSTLNSLLMRMAQHGRLLLLGDFNSQLGDSYDRHIGNLVDPKTTPNGEELVNIVQEHDLWIPSTYEHCQRGTGGTWTHPGAKNEVRIDYIILDHRLGAHNVETFIDEEIDMPGVGEDHKAAAATFIFTARGTRPQKRRIKIDEQAINDPANRADIQNILDGAKVSDWRTDVHTHYAEWAETIYSNLAELYPQKRKQPRRHYISQSTWMTRASKLALKKTLAKAVREGKEEEAIVLRDQVRQAAKQLQQQLAQDRSTHLEDLLGDVDKAAPNEIYAKLRRLGIGTQMKKRNNRALPMMKTADGHYATDFATSQEAWRQHAAMLEAGSVTTGQELLQQCQWRQNQRRGQVPAPSGLNLPSITQLEQACRKIKPFKARGPDGIPGSIYHLYPETVAATLFPLVLKMVCYMEEPLGFKGGRLVHLYKGKGAPDQPENRRGILIANHASKVAHGTIRKQFNPLVECQMLPMQLGGRKGKSVQQSAHMLRLFMATCKAQKLSAGVIFLDVQTAYYKVIRELVAEAPTPREKLSRLIHNFNLPAQSLQQLERVLTEDPTICRQQGMAPCLETLLSELHQDTWFTTQGLESLTHTQAGTRPGSCFADIFFNFLFSHVLREVQGELGELGILTQLQWGGERGLHMDPCDSSSEALIAETIWADDLALYFQHPSPEDLISNLQEACAHLFNICLKYGLQPNFARGKTELLVALRGRNAVQARRRWFTEENGTLPIPNCVVPGCQVRMVARYRHLGGQVDARATAKAEVRARTGQMMQAFRQHRKTVYGTQKIARSRRSSLLRPLVLSIAEYNLGSLVNFTTADQQHLSTALLRMYKAIYGKSDGERDGQQISWPRLCYALGLPSPEAVVHVARLRYYGQILRNGGQELWAMASTEQGWLQACRTSFQWAYRQLAGSTTLQDPASNYADWHNLILYAPRRWKGLLQRAWQHEMLQSYNQCIIEEGYEGFAEAVGFGGFDLPEQLPVETKEDTQHGCIQCQKTFQSRTAWASHAFKCHGRTNDSRRFATGSFCHSCQKEFWEYKRLLHHLQYSRGCRRKLAQAEFVLEELEPGMNSRAQKRQPEELLKPCVQVPGVAIPVKDYWAGIDVEWDQPLLDSLFHQLPLTEDDADRAVDEHMANLRSILGGVTAEYTTVVRTIHCWKDSMSDVAEVSTPRRASLIKAFMVTLGQVDLQKWLLPQHPKERPLRRQDWRQVLEEKRSYGECWPRETVQGEWFRTMFVIHFFSGRRRGGDLQEYLEQLPQPGGVKLEILSADIIFGSGADFAKKENQKKWLAWMSLGYVLGFFAGPPCETFSIARGNRLEGVSIRPIRSKQAQWGFHSLTLRELKQILIGNTLLLFVLQATAIQAAVGHFACVEHPADPQEDKHRDAASIWRMALVNILQCHPSASYLTIQQGKFGAPSPKPTGLLFIGPKQPGRTMQRFEDDRCATGTSIGYDKKNRAFRTARLKEYPSKLCRALSAVFEEWLQESPIRSPVAQPAESAREQLTLFRQSLTEATAMGPDFNAAACAL